VTVATAVCSWFARRRRPAKCCCRLPVLNGDRPPLVVLPPAIDLETPRAVALLVHADAVDERDAGVVGRNAARLNPVKSQSAFGFRRERPLQARSHSPRAVSPAHVRITDPEPMEQLRNGSRKICPRPTYPAISSSEMRWMRKGASDSDSQRSSRRSKLWSPICSSKSPIRGSHGPRDAALARRSSTNAARSASIGARRPMTASSGPCTFTARAYPAGPTREVRVVRPFGSG